MKTRLLALLVALLLALPPLPAGAAPRPRTAGKERSAAALVERAVAAYKAERYLEAGELFLDAYALAHVATQLRNAAKAFEKGEDLERAIRAWQLYLSEGQISPAERSEAEAQLERFEERRRAAAQLEEAERARQAAEAQAVEAREREEQARLRAEQATTASTAATATISAPPPPAPEPRPALVVEAVSSPERSRAVTPYLMLGAGAAALIGSAVVYAHASGRLSDLDQALAETDGSGRVVGIARDQATLELEGVNGERRASLILAGAGAAVALAGLLWLVLAD